MESVRGLSLLAGGRLNDSQPCVHSGSRLASCFLAALSLASGDFLSHTLFNTGHLGDIVPSVPDHHSKENTTIKQISQLSESHEFFGFLVHMKVMFILYHLLSVQKCTVCT